MAPFMNGNDSSNQQDGPVPSSGIRVVIVGAGFAGLTAAIECTRKGHSCITLDSVKEMKQLGDIISFGGNGGRIFQRWPGVAEKLDPICHHAPVIEFRTWLGEHIYTQEWESEEVFGKRFNGHRGEIHQVVYDYALAQGIEIRLGQQVTEYFENEDLAGVISNGERIVGDVVFGADGVKSKARQLVLGYDDKPKPSGYAVYRAWMSSEELAKNELTKDLVIHGDTHTGWLGRDIHFLASALKNGTEMSWVFTHKDDRDVDEGWSEPGNHEDACRILEGWDPIVHTMVKLTPPDKMVDWKLVYRDPLPTWVSPEARTVLIGDAAHPFLPTSIQGAAQAMEDGACLAVCLQLSGKEKARDALRAYEKIRYERVKYAQKTGETSEYLFTIHSLPASLSFTNLTLARDRWHKADWEAVKLNPESIKLVRDPELLKHDAEAHAYKMYAQAVASPHNLK